MQFKTKTAQERTHDAKQWRPAFAWLPRRVAPDRVVWLEPVEVREMVTGSMPGFRWVNQYRLPGSADFFPEYPRTVSDVDKRGQAAIKYPDIEVVPRTEHEYPIKRKFRDAE